MPAPKTVAKRATTKKATPKKVAPKPSTKAVKKPAAKKAAVKPAAVKTPARKPAVKKTHTIVMPPREPATPQPVPGTPFVPKRPGSAALTASKARRLANSAHERLDIHLKLITKLTNGRMWMWLFIVVSYLVGFIGWAL